MRFINREFCRFIFWGGINTLIGYLIYVLLVQLLPYLLAYSIAYAAGIPISYFLNSRFVFREQLRLSKAVRYPLVHITQYLLGTISLYLLVQIFKVNQLLAPALVVMLTIPVTFVLSRRIVASKKSSNTTPDV